MSFVLKLCRRLSTVPPSSLNNIGLEELESLRKHTGQTEAQKALAFAQMQARMKQLNKEVVPFFTVHQELPKCEKEKLEAIERYTDGLTNTERRYLQYLVIVRMKHLQEPLDDPYYSEIKPTVVREAAFLKTEKMARRLNELMLRSR